MPGEYTARMNSGLVPLIGPNRASTWSVKRMAGAARPHPEPERQGEERAERPRGHRGLWPGPWPAVMILLGLRHGCSGLPVTDTLGGLGHGPTGPFALSGAPKCLLGQVAQPRRCLGGGGPTAAGPTKPRWPGNGGTRRPADRQLVQEGAARIYLPESLNRQPLFCRR